mmetsp:Transcript_17741/g.54574  ORF Transcript_17741/g.54574 Transcript_17741/m.54574 type:complete len:202 (-) Transcript_17741:15-620(-)
MDSPSDVGRQDAGRGRRAPRHRQRHRARGPVAVGGHGADPRLGPGYAALALALRAAAAGRRAVAVARGRRDLRVPARPASDVQAIRAPSQQVSQGVHREIMCGLRCRGHDRRRQALAVRALQLRVLLLAEMPEEALVRAQEPLRFHQGSGEERDGQAEEHGGVRSSTLANQPLPKRNSNVIPRERFPVGRRGIIISMATPA